jgi:nicotinamidase-related amidase
MTPDLDHSALVLVDYQARLLPALSGGGEALAQALRLAQVARLLDVDIVGSEQQPAALGPLVESLRALCDSVVAKTAFDACRDGLLDALRAGTGALPRDVVLAGCEAHVCLLQTTLGALGAGLRCWVVADACASRRPTEQALAMQRLAAAGAHIVSAEMVAFEWLRDCRHPRFREVLALIKPL